MELFGIRRFVAFLVLQRLREHTHVLEKRGSNIILPCITIECDGFWKDSVVLHTASSRKEDIGHKIVTTSSSSRVRARY